MTEAKILPEIAKAGFRRRIMATGFPSTCIGAKYVGDADRVQVDIRSLQHLAQDLRAEISLVEGRARTKIAPGSHRLADAIADDFRALLDQAVPLYAQLAAVSTTTRAGSNLLNKLRDVINAASGFHGFAGYGVRQDVPLEISRVLAELDGKGPALKVQFITVANL